MPKPGKKKGQKGGRQNERQQSEPAEPQPAVEPETPIDPEPPEEVAPQASTSTVNEKKLIKERRKELQRQAIESKAALEAARQMKNQKSSVVEPPTEAPKPEPPVEVSVPDPVIEVQVAEVTEALEDVGVKSTKKRRPRKKKGDGAISDSQLVPPPAETITTPAPIQSTSAGPSQVQVTPSPSLPSAPAQQTSAWGSSQGQVTSPPSRPSAPAQPTSAWGSSQGHVTSPPSRLAAPAQPTPAWGSSQGQVTSPPSGPFAPVQPTSAWGSGRGQVTSPPLQASAPVQPTAAWGSGQGQVTSPPLQASAPVQPTAAWGSSRAPFSAPSSRPPGPSQPTSARGSSQVHITSQPSIPAQPTSPTGSSQVQVTSPPVPRTPSQQTTSEPERCRYKIPLKIPTPVQHVEKRKAVVMTNYLTMTFKDIKIRRYDVSFNPDRPKKMIPIVFKQLVKKNWKDAALAFDQMKNCYSIKPLIGSNENNPESARMEDSITVMDINGRPMTFNITIKFTGIVNLQKITNYMQNNGVSLPHPTEEVQCIDVILRQGTLDNYVKAGRQFFKRPPAPVVSLGQGYELWTGLFQSAIFTNKGYINVDVAHKGFPINEQMVNLLQQFRLSPDMSIEMQRGYGAEQFKRFYKGLRVTVADGELRREYICNDLVAPPTTQKFLLNEADGTKREITVADYFSKVKNVKLKYLKFNCMWVGPRDKSIYIPIEKLTVSYGQAIAKQLNETQIATIVKYAATPPSERLQKIRDVISEMKYSTNPEYKRFGLDISNTFHNVTAKILTPPQVMIGPRERTERKVAFGQWSCSQLYRPVALSHWGIVTVDFTLGDIGRIVDLFMSTATSLGMTSAPPLFQQCNVRLTELNQVFYKALEKGVKILFVGVSVRGKDHYHKIKQLAEREVGMLTQCVKEANLTKQNATTFKNILLKVNSKLMGINQVLAPRSVPRCLQKCRAMIVGADVTHPSPDQSNIPSIAAVTASMDDSYYVYNIELSIQTPKKEMIVDFEAMMLDHLRLYKQRNGTWPTKIYVFRDGVSEGQFTQVMNSELTAVYQAYARLVGPSQKPEVLFLLVQKRHHTRFFTTGEKCQNVEPGTVVDTDIVHASQLDFYLVSHTAIKGTARPTRYHAVCNDGKLPDEEVEQLAYYLCHLYSRCTRSVSYPTPTYYAHLACMRARSLTYGNQFDNRELERKPVRLRVLDKMLNVSRMFFV